MAHACLLFRCLTQPPVPSAAPSSCSVSFTRPERSPSAWTRTAAWASSSGAFAGQINKQNPNVKSPVQSGTVDAEDGVKAGNVLKRILTVPFTYPFCDGV